MNRRERLLLLAVFFMLLVLIARVDRTAAVVGAVAGTGVGVLALGRLGRLSQRMDDRLGKEVVVVKAGFSLRRPLLRAGVQLGLLALLFVSTIVIPFIGDELYAATAAFATALPAVVTAARLRR